jgi:hypothetical protein
MVASDDGYGKREKKREWMDGRREGMGVVVAGDII